MKKKKTGRRRIVRKKNEKWQQKNELNDKKLRAKTKITKKTLEKY